MGVRQTCPDGLLHTAQHIHADLVCRVDINEVISHRGYGSTMPLAGFDDGGNYEENRRVEMRLLEPGEEGYRSDFVKVREGERFDGRTFAAETAVGTKNVRYGDAITSANPHLVRARHF
jgi:hypothetical protein